MNPSTYLTFQEFGEVSGTHKCELMKPSVLHAKFCGYQLSFCSLPTKFLWVLVRQGSVKPFIQLALSVLLVVCGTLVLVLVLPQPENWLRGPHLGGKPAGGNKTSGSVGNVDTSLISPVAWPPQCSRGTHLWAYKTHEMREVGYDLE